MTILNNTSKLKVLKSGKYHYLYIYYRYRNNLIRLNTQEAYVERGMTKEGLFKSTVEGYRAKNNKIIELKELVDKYIRIKHNDLYVQLSQKELELILKDKSKRNLLKYASLQTKFESIIGKSGGPVEAKTPFLMNHYLEFYNLKNVELNRSQGMKHYTSLKNVLIDYQKFNGRNLTLDDFNSKNAILSFRNFLSEDRSDDVQFISKGSLANNTIKKRLDCLYRFFRQLEKNNVYKFSEEVFEVKIDGYDNDVITLNNKEISDLFSIKTKNETWRNIINIFVCNCYMGLRFSDLNKLEPHHFINDSEGNCILRITNSKTNISVQIPITEIPLGILQSYEFRLPKLTNQHFNRELKEILKKYKLFEEPITIKRKILNKTIETQQLRRELISSHTCRRTFITLAIQKGIPLNVIMLASGHKKLSTLQKYIALVPDFNAFKGIDKN